MANLFPPGPCLFPAFRQTFWASAQWLDSSKCGQRRQSGTGGGTLPAESRGPLQGSSDFKVQCKAGTGCCRRIIVSHGLMQLDLRSLPREDGPPTELQARREKFAFFEKHCSEVSQGLFLGSDAVARNRDTLRQAGITHVVNCVGFLYPAYFKDELTYKVLFLQDTPAEDITAVMYDVFDFIQAARSEGGRVLVHCSQGVSRSAALLIGYLMWRLDRPYDEVYTQVKAIRGVANPNIGFTCQLLNWQKRRKVAIEGGRLYRIAPQSPAAPTYLVPKMVPPQQTAYLDPRGAFLIHTQQQVYVWQGKRCSERLLTAAYAAAASLTRYEGAPSPPVHIRQGEEPQELLTALASTPLTSRVGSSDGTLSARQAAVRASPRPCKAVDCDAWTQDYQIIADAEAPSPCGTPEAAHDSAVEGSSGSGSGRRPKTPRSEAVEPEGSPNERSRKYRRSEAAERVFSFGASSTSEATDSAEESPTASGMLQPEATSSIGTATPEAESSLSGWGSFSRQLSNQEPAARRQPLFNLDLSGPAFKSAALTS